MKALRIIVLATMMIVLGPLSVAVFTITTATTYTLLKETVR